MKITNCIDPCFAQLATGCKILTTDCIGKGECPFYKPKGCKDWIKIEHRGETWILTPEEYYGEV